MKLCDICGTRHESYQAHVFATNRIATNADATNKSGQALGGNEEAKGCGARQDSAAIPQNVAVAARNRTANRRSVEAYNRYQRDYMRKRRARVPS